MTVPLLFLLIGLVILVGFLANLLFRLTRIPSVLVLIAIGVVLGPGTGWIRHELLLTIAPFFGAVALLVILFEGGLELEIGHVVRHAPRTAVFTAIVFVLSLAGVTAVAHLALGFPVVEALMLGAILGATSPAICMPVVSGLSVRDDVKTVVKLESALGEVLLIVSVVLLIQTRQAGTADASSWAWGFARSLIVALGVATVAGVLWSRLMGWIGREPLSYMLTLGVTCLLYFVVEELGGSPAIAVLLFGLLLANMPLIASRVGPQARRLFGINVHQDQFVLGQFMVNITAELSFLVRTFFFVYLGLLLDFSALSWTLGGWIVVMFVLLLGSRRLGIAILRRSGVAFSAAEWLAVMALQPRGLATAVIALMPFQAGIVAAESFPLFAFVVIVLSNVFMTGGILAAERRLRPASAGDVEAGAAAAAHTETEAHDPDPLPPRPAAALEKESDEPPPADIVDALARLFGLREADREATYAGMLDAAALPAPSFWAQAILAASICALGLIMGQPAVVIGAALIVPLARPVVATGLALATGDLLLLARLSVKLAIFSGLTVAVAATLMDALPFAVTTADLAARTRPTILDFLVALFGGMSGAAIVSRRREAPHYLPGAVIAITLLPALCVVGFALTGSAAAGVLQRAMLQFSANLFAAVLGAGVVLLAVGVPRAAQSAMVRQWKDAQLRGPFARVVFGRFGLDRTIGRTGSVRARVIVVGLFLLVLLTPLQLAFDQVAQELRLRQAIAEAQERFNVPGRSALLGSSTAITDETADVRLQVATDELFGAADVSAFERQVSERTGRRVRLTLVQTAADVGDAGPLGRLLLDPARGEPAEPVRSVSDTLRGSAREVARIVRALPLPPAMLAAATDIDLRGDTPELTVVYLADRAVADDALAVLARLVAAQTLIDSGRIRWQWLSSTHAFHPAEDGSLPEEAAAWMANAGAALGAVPDLRVAVRVAKTVPPETAAMIVEQVVRALGVDRTRLDVGSHDAGTPVTLAVLATPPEAGAPAQ